MIRGRVAGLYVWSHMLDGPLSGRYGEIVYSDELLQRYRASEAKRPRYVAGTHNGNDQERIARYIMV